MKSTCLQVKTETIVPLYSTMAHTINTQVAAQQWRMGQQLQGMGMAMGGAPQQQVCAHGCVGTMFVGSGSVMCDVRCVWEEKCQ